MMFNRSSPLSCPARWKSHTVCANISRKVHNRVWLSNIKDFNVFCKIMHVGLKEKNEMNYKEVMLKQHSYLPKLLPPQVAEVVEKESKSEVPEIPYRDNGDSKTKGVLWH